MSLATDILRQQRDISPKPARCRNANYIEVAAKPKKPRLHDKTEPHIPGVCYVAADRRWCAYFYNGERTLRIGTYPSQKRAHIALRLYKFWRKRAHDNIPVGTTKRRYTKQPQIAE